MNDFLFKLSAYNMPKTMVPGAFQTTFPVKWPLKFNMKLPAYAVGSDLTNLGKDLERLGFGPGTYRTYGANAGTLRQPIKTSNYIKAANNSSGIRELLQELQNSKLIKLADSVGERTFGKYNPVIPTDFWDVFYPSYYTAKFKLKDDINKVERDYDAAKKAAEDTKNKIDAALKKSGIDVNKLDRHYAILALTKKVLEKLSSAWPENKSLNEQINAIKAAMEAIGTLREIPKQINEIRDAAQANLMQQWMPSRFDEYTNTYKEYTRRTQELIKNYDTIARGVLYPAYRILASSGLYNSETGSFITVSDENNKFDIPAINKWFTDGRYAADSPQEKQVLMLAAASNGIIDAEGKFTNNFVEDLTKAYYTGSPIPTTSNLLLQRLESIQPQSIELLPDLTETGAAGAETPVFNLFNIDKDRIRNALGYVIHARRAIEQNAQQPDIQSTNILKNLTNLERSLGSAYVIADYFKNKEGRLPVDVLQILQNRLNDSLASANSALDSLNTKDYFGKIDALAETNFDDVLAFHPNVNQFLNEFGSKQPNLDEEAANELQQKYTDPTVVDTTIKRIYRGGDVTDAAGKPSGTANRGIQLPEPEPQKPDISVVRESLYTVYPEEARKVETLETVMQDPVLNKHYNFTGRINALKQLRDQVEQLAGLVQQNPAYEMAYRRALSTYRNMLNSTLAFANVAAKDVYTLDRMRETINSQFGSFEQPGAALPEDVKKQIQQEKEKKITELFTMQKLWEDWKRQEELARKAVMGNPRYKYREEEALQEILDRRKKEFIRDKLIPALPVENRGRFGSDPNFTAQIENIIFNTNPQQFQKYITGHARESARNLERQYAATSLPQQAQAQQPQTQQLQAQQVQAQQPQHPLAKQPLPGQQALGQPLPEQQLLTPAHQFFAKLLPQQVQTQQPTGQPGQPLTGQQPSGQPSTGQPASGRQLLPPPTQPASVAPTPTATPMQNLRRPTDNLSAQIGPGQNLNQPTGSNLPNKLRNQQS